MENEKFNPAQGGFQVKNHLLDNGPETLLYLAELHV